MISLLGWRPPVRSTAEREIARGATGNLEDSEGLGESCTEKSFGIFRF